jgi:uracil-DNA glycosylase
MGFEIEKSWKEKLVAEFAAPYFAQLTAKVEDAYISKHPTYPPYQNIFSAFTLCPFDKVKVVILGQDPYHGHGQAHGLSFSVPDGVNIPPSLKNIYKEIQTDIGNPIPSSGNLESWAKQGVLLLNATLTVKGGQPASHQGIGWETFTDAIIKKISDEKVQVVFLLWGKYAEAKANLIDQNKHLILLAPHPSPFSAYKGFFGCKHFSKANDYLIKTKQTPIVW